MHPSSKSPEDGARASGVPLGGVGTGKIDFAPDGTFRNITINNNRFAENIIPEAKNAFLAIRCASPQQTAVRILQPSTDIPFTEAGITPPYIFPGEQKWNALYPVSSYQLSSDAFPIQVSWKGTAPIIPYDMEASGLPMVIISVKFKNTTQVRLQVSAMMSWENIRSSFGTDSTPDRGSIEPVYYFAADQSLVRQNRAHTLDTKLHTGLAFGMDSPITGNEDGNYCLTMNPIRGTSSSYMSWDRNRHDDIKDCWNSFQNRGELPNKCSADSTAHMGSVCATALVEAGDTKKLEFVLSWYCPSYTLGKSDVGNAYALEHRDALEVAEQGIKLASYIQAAVSNWHNHFIRSSLPTWYSRMLINSAHVLTSNSMVTRNGEFAMMESPENPKMSIMDRALYHSIGTLLFFQIYAERELMQLSETEHTSQPGRMLRSLGDGCFDGQNSSSMEDPEHIDVNAAFILTAYRNFHMTGKITMLHSLYPRLKAAAAHALELDKNKDGVPDANGVCTTFDGWELHGLTAYSASIWTVAFKAMADLSRHMKEEDESNRYEKASRKALASFENILWNEDDGFYHFQYSSVTESSEKRVCHTGQLIGPWIAEWLDLDCGFSSGRIRKVLERIDQCCQLPHGYARAAHSDGSSWRASSRTPRSEWGSTGWSFHDMAYLAGSDFSHDRTEDGLTVLKTHYERLYTDPIQAFSQPMAWDTTEGRPVASTPGSHSGCMSLWYSLFSIQGLSFSVPTKTLTLKPRFPTGVTKLRLPILTPISFGRLHYEVEEKPEYLLRVRVHFDSPIAIQTIRLAIPKPLSSPRLTVRLNEERVEFTHEIIPKDTHNLVCIRLNEVLQIKVPIQIAVS